MEFNGEYTITSIQEDQENARYIGTAVFPDKIERNIIIDFSEIFKYDPISQEMTQLTIDNKGIRYDSIGNTDTI